MKKEDLLKLIGFGVLIILVVNLILFALQIIKTLIFWIVIILTAVFAYKILPKLRKN